MCEECYDRTVPKLDDIRKDKLTALTFEGTYMTDNGLIVRCHDYIGSSSWEKEWEGYEKLPLGAVYWEVDDPTKGEYQEDIDGGLYPYYEEETVEDWIKDTEGYGYNIISKISDYDEPLE